MSEDIMSGNIMSEENTKKKFRILSISGGGSRGIIPSLVLLKLEQITGRHPCEMFDLFIGTSTGAMISAVLNIPSDPPPIASQDLAQENKPWKYSTKDLLDVYIKEGPIVFESSMWKKMTTINGIYGPMYYTKNRDERFKVWMGETRLKDMLKDVIFTSYDMCTKSPIFFKSRKARSEESEDFLLTDCIKAATAAPTVWPPHPIRDGLYMDALYAKNPTMFSIIEAIHHYNLPTEDVLVASLGTGYSRKHVDPKKIITSGPSFLVEAFNSTINANTMSTMYMIRCLVKDPNNILDIDIPLSEEHMGITDVSKEHVNYLIKVTHEYMAEHEEELLNFARLLIPESEWIKSEDVTKAAEEIAVDGATKTDGAEDGATQTDVAEDEVKQDTSTGMDETKSQNVPKEGEIQTQSSTINSSAINEKDKEQTQ